MMQFKYNQIIRVTNDDRANLIKIIKAEIDKPRFSIVELTQSSIEFKYDIFEMGSNLAMFRYPEGGLFEINSESKKIILSYYISLAPEIIISCIFAIAGFTLDRHLYFFIFFLAAQAVIRLICVEFAANRMMDKIANIQEQND